MKMNLISKLGNGNYVVVGLFRLAVLGCSSLATLLLAVLAWVAIGVVNDVNELKNSVPAVRAQLTDTRQDLQRITTQITEQNNVLFDMNNRVAHLEGALNP